MEGPLEINSDTGVEEPIKSEASIQNPDNNERSDNAASPPPSCSICLGNLVNTSFTDSCLHQFCFICLLQWSKIKTECPLCKQTFKSIIHNVRSEEDYDQYHVNRGLAQVPQNITLQIPRRHYFHPASWISLVNRPIASRRPIDSGIENSSLTVQFDSVQEELPILRSQPPQVPREERRRRIDNPEEYRRNVYRHNLWARPVPDLFGRFRECSYTYYRRQPEELSRLVLWLDRELKVLLNAEHRVLYALNVIRDALTRYDILSAEFRNIVHPFVNIHTDHFLHELYNFAKSNFDLVGYDESVMYFPNALSNEYVSHVNSPATSSTNNNSSGSSSSTTSSSTDDDSDVRIVDEAIDLRVNTEGPSTVTNPMPGPSNTGQNRGETSYFNGPELLIVSSSSSGSDDECEIIGYVKPRHERTPEIIELLDSDSDHLTPQPPQPPQPSNENAELMSNVNMSVDMSVASTSYTKEESVLSSDETTSSDTFSDSDYNPRGKRRRRNSTKKSSGRKLSKQTHKEYMTRSRNKRSRKNCSSYSWNDTDSSSDSSSKTNRKRSRISRYKVQAKDTRRIKRKKDESYSDRDSSSDESTTSTESNNERDISKYRRRRSNTRKHSSSTKNYTAKNERTTRNKALNSEKLKSKSKDSKYSKSRQSRSRSSSVSSNISERYHRPSYFETRRLFRETGECRSQDDCASISKSARSERASKSANRKYSSDLEDEPRTSSHSTDRAHLSAFESYSRWRRIKCKDYPSSSERTFNSSQCNGDSSAMSASVISDVYSDNKNHSLGCYNCYKEKQTSSKSYKRSKHNKSENEKRSRPKKKRHILSSSSSN
ncbi:E3 ubiquitin-protein ligase Topors-like isoform X2 [Pseudomyrmex gracilis]|uniref:E3 ubiquitin-protein ligase Topors-like isoform X2 n=1 Tax=Pseudomyrmex gracilis TaxID=219809 RepID=UPI0009953FB0|nr:E3 ubiquitin-protein ligase Topors-like isoform X2 [Pseudomyrmex gracilis]